LTAFSASQKSETFDAYLSTLLAMALFNDPHEVLWPLDGFDKDDPHMRIGGLEGQEVESQQGRRKYTEK
jgi:hypothetical protein